MSGLPGIPLVIPESGADTIAAAARKIEEIVGKMGWGQPGRMFAFQRDQDVVSVHEAPSLGEAHPGLLLQAFALELWTNPDTAAKVHRRFPRLCGFAVAFEGWVVQEPDDPAERAQLEQDRIARRLDTRPDRVESRIVLVMMDDRREAYVERLRGGPATDGQAMTGMVLQSLRAFAASAFLTKDVAA